MRIDLVVHSRWMLISGAFFQLLRRPAAWDDQPYLCAGGLRELTKGAVARFALGIKTGLCISVEDAI